jgi:phytoene dehydrogenase-like protein
MEDVMDLVVVGAGLAGLTAAVTAGGSGRRVAVLDTGRLGGRARTSERDGFKLNQGPHALYRGGEGMRVLDRLGVTVAGERPALGAAMGSLGGQLARLPVGPGSVATTKLVGARGRVQLVALLGRLATLDPLAFADRTFQAWLDEAHVRADVARVVLALGRLSSYANLADEVSADVVLSQLALSRAGVLYLHGGWQQLVSSLAGRARARGADVYDHRTVLAVHPDGDGAVVETSEGSLRARAVVLAAGSPDAAARLLPQPRIAPTGPAVEAACLDLGLRGMPAHGFVLGIDTPMYLSVHSPPADLAPPGHVVVHVAEYLAARATGDRERLQAHAALAGIGDDDLAASRYLHRMTVVSAAPTPELGGLRGRPGIRVDGHDGIFLAGDWVGPTGFLVDASLASGEQAGLAAARHLERVTR